MSQLGDILRRGAFAEFVCRGLKGRERALTHTRVTSCWADEWMLVDVQLEMKDWNVALLGKCSVAV